MSEARACVSCRRLLACISSCVFVFFFFNDTATTEIYTLSLHDALPISCRAARRPAGRRPRCRGRGSRSEEHTSELQSRLHLVCRLLLEKKTTTPMSPPHHPAPTGTAHQSWWHAVP